MTSSDSHESGQDRSRTIDTPDGAATVLNDALGLVTRRLDDIERKISQTQPSMQSVDAPASQRGTSGRQRIDPRAELTSAIEEIRSRQSELEHGGRRGNESSPRSQTELLRSLRDDFTRKAGHFDARPPADATTAELRDEIGTLRSSIGELATRQEVGAIERAVRDLASQMNEARAGRSELANIAGPLAAVQAEVRRLSEAVSAEARSRAGLDLETMTRKLDDIADRGGKPAQVEELSREIGEIRKVLKDLADPQRMRGLAEQVAGLSQQLTQARRELESTDLKQLVSAVDEIKSTVNSRQSQRGLAEELERLSNRVDGALASSGNPAGIARFMDRLEQLNDSLSRPRREAELKPIEDMLRSLAEKIDQARPGGNLDSLEKQVALLAQRIERTANQPGVAFFERSMADLFRRLDELRGGTAEIAERAAKAAVASAIDALPKASAPELGAIKEELAGLKRSQGESGKWTKDTFAAVHATLDRIVARLAPLDADTSTSKAALSQAAEVSSPAETSDKRLEESLKQLEAELVPSKGKDTDGGKADEEEVILLDPGSARPKRQTPNPTVIQGGAAGEPHDIKAAFIAAARRAAHAAAAEAVAAKDEPRHGKSARRGEAGRDRHHAGTRTKRSLEGRRRAVLLGLAAVVMALGAFQIGGQIGRTWFEHENKAILASRNTDIKIASPSASVPGSRDTSPTTTAALPESFGPPAREASGPAAQPADASSAPAAADGPPRERQAALPEPKSSSRLERAGGKPDATEAAAPPASAAPVAPHAAKPAGEPPLEKIPDMAGIQIPANVGAAGLRQAALAGDPMAVYELGVRAAEGRGMARDLALSAKLFEKVAAHGFAPAQYRTGNLYEKGLGVQRDLAAAKTWYQRAAEKGNARAMHNLAVLFAEGVGGKPDYVTAVNWFRRAAQHGIRDSQFNLAVLLARGLGTPQDLTGSYTWFSIVATQGDEDAGKKREEVGSKLGPSELAAAKLAAERWRPETPDKFANEVTPPPQGWTEAPPAKAPAKNGKV